MLSTGFTKVTNNPHLSLVTDLIARSVDFLYFAYGSNMGAAALRAKGVVPMASAPARLPGYALRFSVRHFFAHEGGVGNIEPDADDEVWGVLHRLGADALGALDAAELYPQGYDRIEVEVIGAHGALQRALTYVGTPGFHDPQALPTRRYLNILLQGAVEAGLPATWIGRLRAQPVLQQPPVARWAAPPGEHPQFDAAWLAGQPRCTVLDDAVFDMADARYPHPLVWPLYGGRDTTLHHLRRMDGASGHEGDAHRDPARWTKAQRQHIDRLLHAYATEYRYIGRWRGAVSHHNDNTQPPEGPLHERA